MTIRIARLLAAIGVALSIGGLLYMAVSSAHAQQASACATLDMRLNEVKQLGIAQSEVLIITDVTFINDYTKASGLGIPEGSAPAKLLLVTFGAKAYVGLVEIDGCVRHEAAIPIGVHLKALKAATAGV